MSIMYEKIKRLCDERGIKIAQMCREANVYQGAITDLKKGRSSSLSASNLQKLAKYFGVPMESFLGEEKEKPAPEGELDSELTVLLQDLRDRPEMRMLFSLTHSATKEDVEQAVKIIEAIRK